MWLQFCWRLAAWLLPSLSEVAAQSFAAEEVSTGLILQTAINNGAAHVLILDHLDMARLTQIECGPRLSLLCVAPATHPSTRGVSIRAHCQKETRFTQSVGKSTLPALQPYQCIVMVSTSWLTVLDRDVWVHNVHAVLRERNSADGFVNMEFVTGGAAVWNTHVGLQGDGGLGTLVTAVGTSKFTSVDGFLADFEAPLAPAGYSEVPSIFSYMKIERCKSTGATEKGALVAAGAGARVVCIECVFDAASAPPLAKDAAASVYADNASVWNVNASAFQDALRLDDVGNSTMQGWLTLDYDKRFSEIREEAERLLPIRSINAQELAATTVYSGEELQRAVNSGGVHTLIGEHLDMRGLARQDCDKAQFSWNSTLESLLCVMPSTHPLSRGVSIRGHCVSRFEGDTGTATLPNLAENQCVIRIDTEWIRVSNRDLWIANVHVVLLGRSGGEDRIEMYYMTHRARTWNTQVGLQGDSRVGRHMGITQTAMALLTGGYLADFTFPNAPAIYAAGSMCVSNTRVERCVPTRATMKGAMRTESKTGVLRCTSCSFDNDSSPGLAVSGNGGIHGKVYAESFVTVFNNTSQAFQPADSPDQAASGTFLETEGNDAFLAIQREAERLLPISSLPSRQAAAIETNKKASTTTIVFSCLAAGLVLIGLLYLARPYHQRRTSGHSAHHEPSKPALPSSVYIPTPPATTGTTTTTAGHSAPGSASGSTLAPKAQGQDSYPNRLSVPTHSNSQSTGTALVMTSDIQSVLRESNATQHMSPRARIHTLLDKLYWERGLLFGRFRLPGVSAAYRRRGGQAVVQFVLDATTHKPFAAKFFLKQHEFERERELYEVAELRAAMPAVVQTVDSWWRPAHWDDSSRLPPCLVMEQGKSLSEYVQEAGHDVFTTIQALGQLARKLGELHRAGWVHRDLKPGNLLWNPSKLSWSLLDFGCAARSGSDAGIAYSLSYAAPEVLQAVEDGQGHILVTPAMDMWSLGVIAFEMLTERKVFEPFTTKQQAFDAILGRKPMLWEDRDKQRRKRLLSKLGGFRDAILACLERNPAQRIDCDTLYHQWTVVFSQRLGDTTITATIPDVPS